MGSNQDARLNRLSVLNPAHVEYLAELLQDYQKDPSLVDASWHDYLKEIIINQAADMAQTFPQPLPKRVKGYGVAVVQPQQQQQQQGQQTQQSQPSSKADIALSLRAYKLIEAYRTWGHLQAVIDPLLTTPKGHPQLELAYEKLDQVPSTTRIELNGECGLTNPTIAELHNKLKGVYCQSVGFEYMHIQDTAQRLWLQNQIEQGLVMPAATDKIAALQSILKVQLFERFLQVKFAGAKRFGLEGGDAFNAVLELMITLLTTTESHDKAKEIVLGMAHRGRLSTLVNVLASPLDKLLAQFKGYNTYKDIPQDYLGDVKYHAGASCERVVSDQRLRLTLLPNPSHLEAVNPVVTGYVRARQDALNDTNRSKVVGILVHGDAAFAGQGLVSETLEMCALDGYQTGGTLHIIINNQVGFTADPQMSRSTTYASDLAKKIDAPIFHVNGEDIETLLWVTKIATTFKQVFKRDVVIDLLCYRRHGHNEMDEPMFTQPLMYKTISQKEPIGKMYADSLKAQGVITAEQEQAIINEITHTLNQALEAAQAFQADTNQVSLAQNRKQPVVDIADQEVETGIANSGFAGVLEMLQTAHKVPDGFQLNSKVQRVITQRIEMLIGKSPIDWAMGEILAFGTLMLQGAKVRLSGQDSGRGTFSHRHSVWTDQNTQNKYIPLQNLHPQQATFEVIDSYLSEAAVLGFEYGYSIEDQPDAAPALTLWEGQFGDFANGAQVMIDQFIASAYTKWQQRSTLVMLLPHGYEGQGPEHSSARLERYLQLSAHRNWRVVNCTTPANLFHALRRQVIAQEKTPLIVMTPKVGLRHKLATSQLVDFQEGTKFMPVIADDDTLTQTADRHVFCSGKVYYDLMEERDRLAAQTTKGDKKPLSVAIHRLEQVYPFPKAHIKAIIAQNPHADIVWAQEEPVNQGAWMFVKHRFEAVVQSVLAQVKLPTLNTGVVGYAGRMEAASPATGYQKRHLQEQAALLKEALSNPIQPMKWD